MQKLFFILSLFIFPTIIGLFFGLVLPKFEQIQARQGEVQKKQVEYKSLEASIENLKKISQRLKQSPEEVSKIEQALPEGPNLEQVFTVIQKLAVQNGLLLKGIDIESPVSLKEGRDILTLSIDLKVLGAYQSFKNFLAEIERSVRMFNIELIVFSSPGDKIVDEMADEVIYSFEVRMRIHFY